MRSDVSATCSLNQGNPNALAAIYYEDADTNGFPTSKATTYHDNLCANDDLNKTIPFFPFPATSKPAFTQELNITFGLNATKYNLFYINNQTFRANYDHRVLLLANDGNTSYPYDPEWNVYNFGTNASIRLVAYNEFAASHPMHLHGHNFNVLAEGVGEWNGAITHQYNTQRRDVQLVQGGTPASPGYVVLQYETDNPGVWPFDCHIAWHVSAGLYINTMEQTEKIKEVLPESVNEVYTDWRAFSGSGAVDEIDSGLRTRGELMPGMPLR